MRACSGTKNDSQRCGGSANRVPAADRYVTCRTPPPTALSMAVPACFDREPGFMSLGGMTTSLSSPRKASVSVSGLSKSPARVSTPSVAILSGVREMATMFALVPRRALSSRMVAAPRGPLAPLPPMFMAGSPCLTGVDVLCAVEERVPVLRPRPELEVVEGDVRELTAKRSAVHRIADAVQPFGHPDAVLAHALADDIDRYLVIGEGAAGDARENGDDVIPRELVACELESLAREATRALENANGDRPDVCDGDLRERPRRREGRPVDPFRELLLAEVEVLHEVNGRENRCADADLGNVLFDLVLAVEVRNAGLSVGGAD